MRGLAFVALYLAGTNLAIILLLNVFVSTVTVFFAPAELAMIPVLVPRSQLLAASGIFTLTLNAAFAIGFALLGPLVVKVAGAPSRDPRRCGPLYLLAAVFCVTLPAAPPPPSTEADPHSGLGVGDAERAVGSTFGELREGFAFIRANRSISVVADLPRDHRIADRRAGRPRSELRQGDARPRRRRTSWWSSCPSGSGS